MFAEDFRPIEKLLLDLSVFFEAVCDQKMVYRPLTWVLLVRASSAAIKSFSVNRRPPLGVMVPEMAELSESDRFRVCFMTRGKGYEFSSSSSWVPCQAKIGRLG